MSKKPDTMKKILFWTAVVFMPGGILLAAYRLGTEHRKIKKILNNQLDKLKRSNNDLDRYGPEETRPLPSQETKLYCLPNPPAERTGVRGLEDDDLREG